MDARTTRNTKAAASGLNARAGAMNDSAWAYYGNTEYEGNFTADIDAVVSEGEYPSIDNNARATLISYDLNVQASGSKSGINTSAGRVITETATSLKVHHGSIYDLAAADRPADYEYHTTPSRFEGEENGPSQIDMWMSTQERHELISYQGVQAPTKRLKAAKGRSNASTKKSSRR